MDNFEISILVTGHFFFTIYHLALQYFSRMVKSDKKLFNPPRVAVSAIFALVGGGMITPPNSKTKRNRKAQKKRLIPLSKYFRKYTVISSLRSILRSPEVKKVKI